MIRVMLSVMSFLIFVVFQAAWGQSPSAMEAYTAGHYDAAIADVAADRGADACAFSARSLLAKAISGEAQPAPGLLQGALDEANAALAADPGHIEGRLQKAIALSLMARPMSLREARDSGYGEEARQLAESVLRDDPQNAYAHGFLAVWNLEVMRRGGMLGAMIMGASLDAAEAHYEAAAAASPGDAALNWQFARALATLNARKYRDEISAALDAALAAPVDDQLERVMQDRARILAQAMATQKNRDIEALAEGML
ncbi:hypothetical protein [Hyphomonas chukchiensis]|nr:hypothetical protein [Hyphomonas chukchiensis]